MAREAFEKLNAIIQSQSFKALRSEIIINELSQCSYMSAKDFNRYADEMGYRLIWDLEIDYCIRNGSLFPSFQNDESKGRIPFDAPTSIESEYLQQTYFHPYKIVEVFASAEKYMGLRDALVIWWRKKTKKRNSLRFARETELFNIFNFQLMNSLCELSIMLEPIYLPSVTGRISYRSSLSRLSYHAKISEIKSSVIDLTSGLSIDDWREIHSRMNFISNCMDSNSELKTLITLMRLDDQKRIKGRLGAALLVREMAQMMRYLAKDHNIELEEEQFSESPGYSKEYFTHLRGSKMIVDGPRENKLKFVRGFGLDFSIRVRLYVEGATEYSCFRSLFGDSVTIEVIDLQGAFSQRNGKGIAFRESLRNDLSHHIYSIIVLDGDRADNIRVVKEAAGAQDFLGCFYINDPDFEFGNFSLKELCEIININSGANLSYEQFAGASNAKELFRIIREHGVTLCKGEEWGKMLGEYAVKNPRSQPLGMPFDDRTINQVVRFYQFSSLMNFANDVKNKITDPSTGLMTNKPET